MGRRVYPRFTDEGMELCWAQGPFPSLSSLSGGLSPAPAEGPLHHHYRATWTKQTPFEKGLQKPLAIEELHQWPKYAP